MFAWKYALFFFSKFKKNCNERINKIRLAGKFTNESNATAKPKRENPIAPQRFTNDADRPSQPHIIPPKKATTIPP